MKTSLGQRQLLLQKLSPQQIQLMKLLQIPTALLEQRIKEEMEENPALEETDDEFPEEQADFDTNTDAASAEDAAASAEAESDETQYSDENFDLDDYLNGYMEDDPASYKERGDSYQPEEEEKTMPVAIENSFHEYLEQQIGLLNLSDEKEKTIALQIIGSIDEDGYLRREPYAIADDLLFSQNIMVEEKEVVEILKKIQRMDPPGIGARDLQECLYIQLQLRIEQGEDLEDEELIALKAACKIINRQFEAFSKRHYEKLQRQFNLTEKQLKAAYHEIMKLNPKPASGYIAGSMERSSQYIIPDFIVLNRDGELELTLNVRNAPDLRISDSFREMLRGYNDQRRLNQKLTRSQKETVQFIRQKIESARWFIDAIRQRHETMYKSMYAIMDYQSEYFLSGDEKKIRPMILQDIADRTGLDVSTVSRVANSKYVQTEFGTRRLKEFFSEALQTSDGEEVSTLEVKKILTEIIAAEDKRKPLSDDKLTQLLQEKGYNIARRTVAKYREQLNVSKASLRKQM
ncbi:MAG TPA: RNA polymerase factor sigma-54 [Haliscomenobacter sp.]|nr:RNA polymerase factor sigma-54 [Haliscomenobacter sp.]HOY19138.1 RNA polymerase factor sigma-54 [Haliscomenobacter sp.]HPH19549.1 RNA polymerase factor sigma-54 [Haliscomenobacter sp.]